MGLARWPETRHDRCRFTLGLDCFFGSLYGLKRGFLLMAQKTIPMGTAYAVWTGIGAVGAFVLGILFFSEVANFARFFFIGLIIVGIVGLKLSSPH